MRSMTKWSGRRPTTTRSHDCPDPTARRSLIGTSHAGAPPTLTRNLSIPASSSSSMVPKYTRARLTGGHYFAPDASAQQDAPDVHPGLLRLLTRFDSAGDAAAREDHAQRAEAEHRARLGDRRHDDVAGEDRRVPLVVSLGEHDEVDDRADVDVRGERVV